MTSMIMEASHWLPGDLRLLLREQSLPGGDPVLYVHGATFPSACSIMLRFDGLSWADVLNRAGFSVFGLDFAGYGGSERYGSRPAGAIPGRAAEACDQITRAVDFIRQLTGAKRVSIIAHSWGTIPAGAFATRHPEQIAALIFFGPILPRKGSESPAIDAPTRLVTVQQQYDRFVEDVPKGHPPILLNRHFESWTRAYLASDSGSGAHNPPAVSVPNGPVADIMAARSGTLGYDPADITAPLLVARGEWDSLCTDADVRGFRKSLASLRFEDMKISEGTHLMHLEESRAALHRASTGFLRDILEPVKD